MRASLFYFLLCLQYSCQTSFFEATPESTSLMYSNVDQRLWTYFNEFEKVALQHSVSIDLSDYNLTAEIASINEDYIAGVCQYSNRSNDRYIKIDQDFWNNSSSLYKEYIIFHELGHCILGRSHREGCFTNGIYLSLMRSGNGNCRDFYSSTTRDYYLNELFGTLGNIVAAID